MWFIDPVFAATIPMNIEIERALKNFFVRSGLLKSVECKEYNIQVFDSKKRVNQ